MSVRTCILKSISVLLFALLSMAASANSITVTYYHNDATGSPVAATNQQGQVVWRKAYTPYGETSNKDGDNKIGFTGHTEDQNGLVYTGARYYDPALGRFTGTDSVGFSEKNPMSFNRYAYANDNPYKYVDPDGKNPAYIGVLVYGAIAGGVGGYVSSSNSAAHPYGKLVGTASGMLAGLITSAALNPEGSVAAGMLAGAASSAAGQIVGSAINASIVKGPENISFSDINFSPLTTVAGGLGAGTGGLVSAGVAESFAGAPIVGSTLEAAGAPTYVGRAAGAITEGAITGLGEKIANETVKGLHGK